jgi:hypothetical protein
MDKETEKNLSYSIIFDVPESGVEVNTFAEGMRDCLLALEEINNAIVGGIDTSIQVVSYIERLSAGSVQFDLKDDIKAKDGKADKAIEATFAGITSVYGDPTGMILITLKAAKDAIFKINDKRTNNKQKKEEIKSEITTILQSSNLNNDLKGCYLDDKRLNKAISHFAKGVKKTGDNVFYKSTNESEKLRINSSLADSIEGQDKKDEEAEEEKILQITNTKLRFMKKLTIHDLKKDTSFMQVNFNSFIFFDKTGQITGLFSSPLENEDIKIEINHINKDIFFAFTKGKDETLTKQLRINHQKIWMGFASSLKSDNCIELFLDKINKISPTLEVTEFARLGYRTIFYYELDNEEEEKYFSNKFIKVSDTKNFSLKMEIDTKKDFKNTMSLSIASNPSLSDKKLLLIDLDLFFDTKIAIKDLDKKLKELSSYTYQDCGMLSIING